MINIRASGKRRALFILSSGYNITLQKFKFTQVERYLEDIDVLFITIFEQKCVNSVMECKKLSAHLFGIE